jgi:hypothetical protein
MFPKKAEPKGDIMKTRATEFTYMDVIQCSAYLYFKKVFYSQTLDYIH